MEYKLTSKQHKKADTLWRRFFDVFNLGSFTDAKKATVLLKEIQSFFKEIGYQNGVWCVESVLLDGDKATDWDYDDIKGLLHTFVESFQPDKREVLELMGETLKLQLRMKGINTDTYFKTLPNEVVK